MFIINGFVVWGNALIILHILIINDTLFLSLLLLNSTHTHTHIIAKAVITITITHK